MQLDSYRRFTAELLANVSAHSEVLGLVALGSMAEQGELPDAYSDHDFFVVVTPEAAEAWRERDAWLPDAANIALRYRETAHGVKAIYRAGHLVEFAVFTPDELALARVNRYRVLLDRADVGARMAAVRRETERRGAAEAPGDGWLVGQFLSACLVSALRTARGEHLSGRRFLGFATEHLLRLVARHVPSEGRQHLDDLDSSRRFERAYPTLATEIATADAHGLLVVAERELAHHMSGFPSAALAVVRERCATLGGTVPSE